jgi:cytochrome c
MTGIGKNGLAASAVQHLARKAAVSMDAIEKINPEQGQAYMTMRTIFPILATATIALCAAVAPTLVSAAPPAAADAVAGKRVFLRCMACHTVQAGGPNKVGPNLSGVVGRKSGQTKGFRYSAAMTKANVTWNDATLDKWLTRPASVVPGNSMVFAGLSKPEDRKAVIAYLKKPAP